VILAVNDWEPPSLIGLCELENKEVLEDIVNHTLLVKFPYGILHRDSPDRRGIDVAILYRTDLLTCIDTCWIPALNEEGETIDTREILSAQFIHKEDTILFIMNHWTSKYGGEMETEEKRKSLALQLGQYIKEEMEKQANLYIISGGDFNDYSKSISLQILREQFLLKEIKHTNGLETYKYKGKWESIDHVFIAGILDPKKCFSKVPNIPILLEADEKYTGKKPSRTYSGYRYNGGISDHLPLLLFFETGKLLGD
jgi:endonuclease/exonuclease/phosphatase family metal-dependent hydrolase